MAHFPNKNLSEFTIESACAGHDGASLGMASGSAWGGGGVSCRSLAAWRFGVAGAEAGRSGS